MDNDDAISTLNDLIETSKDGEQGFRTAAKDAKASEVLQILTAYAESCATGARQLQDLVRQLGGDPERSGSVSGAVHRGWFEVRSAITTQDDAAVLSECERGEDVAKRKYKEALEKELPENVRSVVQRQYDGVLQHHDRIKAMRDQYAART